ncbi:MAG: outer membrane protein transport protein, partial [Bacteroidaceae bacterium]|nr:outer membrane protein transport protein [Bacteroidaceae bacterium]
LTLGATVGLRHNIGSKVEYVRYTSLGDTVTFEAKKAFDLPLSVSAGATWQFRERLSIGADYTLQRWQGCRVPVLGEDQTNIVIATDQYRDMHRVALGAEYTHDPNGLKYTDHIRYRLGGSYSTPYVKVNNLNGPTELRLTAGVAVPVKASARSLINVSVEWLKRTPSASYQIKENYFLVHLGVTFNEAWFMKRKFQ